MPSQSPLPVATRMKHVIREPKNQRANRQREAAESVGPLASAGRSAVVTHRKGLVVALRRQAVVGVWWQTSSNEAAANRRMRLGPRSGPGVAAVGEEFGAGDERRGVRGQEEGGRGDFLGVGQPPQGHDGLGEPVDVRPRGAQ